METALIGEIVFLESEALVVSLKATITSSDLEELDILANTLTDFMGYDYIIISQYGKPIKFK